MAMEYKTLDIPNEEEAITIEFWQQFGWKYKSSQRVYNQNSHQEYDQLGSALQITTVTKTVDFTKLVLERDRQMPNYDRVAKLEYEYVENATTQEVLSKEYREIQEELKSNFAGLDIRAPKTHKIHKRINIFYSIIIMAEIILFSFLDIDADSNLYIPSFALIMTAPFFPWISAAVWSISNRRIRKSMKKNPNSASTLAYQERLETEKKNLLNRKPKLAKMQETMNQHATTLSALRARAADIEEEVAQLVCM